MKIDAYRLVLCLLVLLFSACNKGEKSALPSTDPDASVMTKADLAKAVAAVDKSLEADSETDTDTDNDSESEQAEANSIDGGVREDGRITISDPPQVNELAALATLMKKRNREIDLREREASEREQTLSALERVTVKQTAELTQLRSEITTLMESLNRDFEVERAAFEEKQKKEAAARAQKEKAAAAAEATEAEKRKKLAAEMAEERENRTAQLTAAIKGMRPSSGAAMLASMDQTDAVAVLRQLGARQAAQLLGNMPANTAAALAQAMLGPKPTIDTLDGTGSKKTPTDSLRGEK